MSDKASRWLRLLFGRKPELGHIAVFFSARLDETGTDGRSAYAMVAGGVSVPDLWDDLEGKWNRLLTSRGVSAFHYKEFAAREDEFEGWGDLKHKNFRRGMEKAINKTVAMQIAVAVHRDTHAKIKKKWTGVKGFKADSDCGICFRVARLLICNKLAEWRRIGTFTSEPKVQFIVEDGPYAAGTATIYQEIVRTKSEHAEMLAGFASIPKGQLRSLEAADYTAGRSKDDLDAGIFLVPGRKEQISALLDQEFLEEWNEDMVQEKERRRAFWKNKIKDAV